MQLGQTLGKTRKVIYLLLLWLLRQGIGNVTDLGNPNQLLAANCNQFASRAIGKAPDIVQVMVYVETNNYIMAKESQIC